MKYHVEFDLDFKRNTYPGRYIVLEGVNASGKTTQIEDLKNYFQSIGKEVVVTSEPNDALAIGKLIRQIITGKTQVPSAALQYLYTADRIVNHESIVIPALKSGKIVLSSRSFWSAIVYGAMDRGGINYTKPDADLMLVSQGVLSMYHMFLVADYTFYLDVAVDTVLGRMTKMNNMPDIYEKKEKLTQLIEGYLWMAKQFPKEITRIDGEKSEEEVTAELIEKIKI